MVLSLAVLILHILSVMVAVGSATLVDYLHVVGLRRRKLEKKLVSIYPFVSQIINISLVLIYLTGIFLVVENKLLLQNPLFITKILLVLIVTFNGIYLQRSISPHLDKCVLKGTKYCKKSLLTGSAISGSISIVTWYSIVVLSLSKEAGYSLSKFILFYFVVLLISIFIAYTVERKARTWRN